MTSMLTLWTIICPLQLMTTTTEMRNSSLVSLTYIHVTFLITFKVIKERRVSLLCFVSWVVPHRCSKTIPIPLTASQGVFEWTFIPYNVNWCDDWWTAEEDLRSLLDAPTEPSPSNLQWTSTGQVQVPQIRSEGAVGQHNAPSHQGPLFHLEQNLSKSKTALYCKPFIVRQTQVGDFDRVCDFDGGRPPTDDQWTILRQTDQIELAAVRWTGLADEASPQRTSPKAEQNLTSKIKYGWNIELRVKRRIEECRTMIHCINIM